MTTFPNASSKSFGLSEASTSRAMATKRLWRSASVSFDFDGGLRGMTRHISHYESGSHRRRRLRSRLGLVCCPLLTSCLIGETFSFDALQREIGPRRVVNAELDAVGIAEVELAQIPFQM